MNRIDATVVVSCYNQEKYIEDALQSILSQETNFEFEIIVADDCSLDKTASIVCKLAESYPSRIQAILRSSNIGADKNYLDLHQRANGEVVFHFDGDDIMLPGKLQEQYNLFQRFPNVNLVLHRAKYFSDDLEYVSETGWPFQPKEYEQIFSIEDLAHWGTIAVHGSYAYRKSSRKTYTMNRPFMEWFFAMESLFSGSGMYLNKVLMEYRCNPSEKSYTSTRLGRLKAFKIVFEDIKHYFDLYSNLKKHLYVCYLINFISTVKSCKHFEFSAFFFLIKHVQYFDCRLLFNAIKIRIGVAPKERIR
ncbi:glycosyltransferase [Chitinimonas sp. BJB300]|uniref:glycosyltransferase n=1 Tax=Chitinimonas sp. BJB300 TaxID=1559339 RepID=UPI000C1220A6|nr:glycosyltransferase [Chitinimonas sp. BJB300]PHV11154.1 glycosyl transferase [Chitinimonas sp. BJB300]TSJ85562.1 glycosyltransferase [Chitinimonas sp. BJB300]